MLSVAGLDKINAHIYTQIMQIHSFIYHLELILLKVDRDPVRKLST